MIDWLYSKVTITIAVFIMIVFFLGFFEWYGNSIAVEELNNITDEISSQIDDMVAIDANTKQTITFNRSAYESVKLPPTIRGDPYEITITKDIIFGDWEGAKVSSDLVSPSNSTSTASAIHFWEPEEESYLRTDINQIDDSHGLLEIDSGESKGFILDRKLIEVSGHLEYHLFIYEIEP